MPHPGIDGRGPYYAPLAEINLDEMRRDIEQHMFLPIQVARNAIGTVRPGGSIVLIGGTGGRRAAVGFSAISTLTAGLPALTRNLALEIAPIRVNLVASGFVDTPLSARLLADQLAARREELRSTLPIRRVVEPEDVAARCGTPHDQHSSDWCDLRRRRWPAARLTDWQVPIDSAAP